MGRELFREERDWKMHWKVVVVVGEWVGEGLGREKVSLQVEDGSGMH